MITTSNYQDNYFLDAKRLLFFLPFNDLPQLILKIKFLHFADVFTAHLLKDTHLGREK